MHTTCGRFGDLRLRARLIGEVEINNDGPSCKTMSTV